MNVGLSGLFGANMINFYFSEKSSHSYAFTKLIIAVYKLVCCSLCVCVCASVCVCVPLCVCVCVYCVCDHTYDMYDVCHAECLDSGSHRGQ